MTLNGNVTDFKITNNLVHDNDNIGIDFIGYEGTRSRRLRRGYLWGSQREHGL